jgi:hypothetical protein
MVDRMPWEITAAGADCEKAAPAARPRPGRHLIAVMLLTAAVLDLTRCGLVLAAARHPAPTAGLAAAGLAAAVLSVRTARGCQAGRRWAGLAALLIGAASAPQAAMSGFHGPYTIPDTATAVVGVLLAVAVLATAGAAGQPGQDEPQMPLTGDQHPVQAVAVDPADPALGDRVRARRLHRRPDGPHSDSGGHGLEGCGELGGPVTDQELKIGGLIAELHRQVAGLLSHPHAGGVGGDGRAGLAQGRCRRR